LENASEVIHKLYAEWDTLLDTEPVGSASTVRQVRLRLDSFLQTEFEKSEDEPSAVSVRGLFVACKG